MKTRIIRTEGLTFNHNQSGLKVKPQLTKGLTFNHSQTGLQVKQ